MSLQRFSNGAKSALASGISIGVTSFSVDPGDGNLFPSLTSGQYFYARIGTDADNEVVKVTSRSTDTMTCTETTKAWSTGALVMLSCSAESLGDLAQANGGGQVLQDHELRDYSETVATPTISSGSLTLDYSAANVFSVSLTANVASLTISNPPASGKAGSFTLILTQDATGGRSFTWPSSVTWAGGTEPTITATANAVDVLTFLTIDGGTTWRGMLAGANFS